MTVMAASNRVWLVLQGGEPVLWRHEGRGLDTARKAPQSGRPFLGLKGST